MGVSQSGSQSSSGHGVWVTYQGQRPLINTVLGMKAGFGKPIVGAMVERFRGSIKEESDGHTGREEHHKVRLVGEFGIFIGFAQFDVAISPGKEELRTEHNKSKHVRGKVTKP